MYKTEMEALTLLNKRFRMKMKITAERATGSFEANVNLNFLSPFAASRNAAMKIFVIGALDTSFKSL